jgi:hypothetical protein
MPLRRALVAGLLDSNRHREAGADDLNVGHGMWTSDNATLWGHRISPEGYISIAEGVMVTVQDIGWRVGEPALDLTPLGFRRRRRPQPPPFLFSTSVGALDVASHFARMSDAAAVVERGQHERDATPVQEIASAWTLNLWSRGKERLALGRKRDLGGVNPALRLRRPF